MGEGFFGLLRRRFERAMDRPFLRVPGGATVTYGEMDERSALAAGWLRSLGVAAGDRVVVQLPKSVDAVALYLGILRLGAVHVPLNTAYTPAEVEWFVADAEPAAVVHDAGSLARGLHRSQPVGGVVERGPEDLAALVYTSGTTGRPKGAMLTHGNLASNALTLERAWAFQRTDVLLHALPIFHVHGLMVALHTAMLSTCEVIFLERFDTGEALASLPDATVMMGVPTHYSRLMTLEGFDAGACSRVRLLISGSAPMTAELHRAVARRTGCRVLERYGMSEALMITSNPYDGARVAGTVGFALPGVEVRVCDDDGAEVVERAGMVQVRGPNVGPGYWRRPDATSESRTTDGWFITGDVGRLDGDGRLTLEGRATDMIISGGLNVYPVEIEQILDAHPAVVESAVVGLAHPDLGEAVTAFVVPVPGTGGSGRGLTRELAGTLTDIARFKHPKRFVTVEQLPRNAMGKVLKAELRAHYADLFSK
ncbi:MAG: AMP-binding protein [Acidimicrobiaceae bacterium]|nr:AMP-binding protein [Acidimicrobiaceae bacterium]